MSLFPKKLQFIDLTLKTGSKRESIPIIPCQNAHVYSQVQKVVLVYIDNFARHDNCDITHSTSIVFIQSMVTTH